MQSVKCSRCREKLEATEYDTPTLKNQQQEERLHEAVCLHCAPQHLPKGWEDKKTTCSVCLEKLPLLAFSVAMQKQIINRNYSKVRCLQCQYPRCSSCGQQAQSLPNVSRAPKSKEDRDNFFCLACMYPNCSGCGQAMEEWRKRPSQKNKTGCMAKRGHALNAADDSYVPVFVENDSWLAESFQASTLQPFMPFLDALLG